MLAGRYAHSVPYHGIYSKAHCLAVRSSGSTSLFCRLEDKADGTLDSSILLDQAGSGGKRCRMPVMTAFVRDTRHHGAIGKLNRLVYRQGIHIGMECDRRCNFRPFRTEARREPAAVVSECCRGMERKGGPDPLLRRHLSARELGMGMKRVAERRSRPRMRCPWLPLPSCCL